MTVLIEVGQKRSVLDDENQEHQDHIDAKGLELTDQEGGLEWERVWIGKEGDEGMMNRMPGKPGEVVGVEGELLQRRRRIISC